MPLTRLHQLVDRAGAQALYVGFLHDGGEGLLGRSALCSPWGGANQALYVELHQPLRRIADRLAQEAASAPLLKQLR